MSRLLELLRGEPRARRFLAAQTQSALGTGLGYVALLTIAFDRSHSAWAVTAILVAEFAPAALLGSVIGVLSDRVPRRTILVGADVLRFGAFAGLMFAASPLLIVALAIVAGVGNAAFVPTALAGLPDMVSPARVAAATGLFGTIDELGYLVGPALAAVLLTTLGVHTLLLANAVSFAVSACVLARLDFGRSQAAAAAGTRRRWMDDLREGARSLAGDRTLAPLLLCSAAFVLFLGGVNVGELLLVRESLHAGASAYALVVTAMGAGVSIGALIATRGGEREQLKRGYLLGLALAAGGLMVAGLAPGLTIALVAFLMIGVGNGAAVCFERVLLQRLVPGALRGRVFGLRSSLMAWAMGGSFVVSGLAGSLLGGRALLTISGIGAAVAAGAACVALRERTVRSNMRPELLEIAPDTAGLVRS